MSHCTLDVKKTCRHVINSYRFLIFLGGEIVSVKKKIYHLLLFFPALNLFLYFSLFVPT